MKYTIVTQWSEADNCFVVFLPDFESVMQPVTHGDTYDEALQNAQEVLDLLTQLDDGNLPPPQPLLQMA
jgi:predicted RNase H-like HicB family nuclease